MSVGEQKNCAQTYPLQSRHFSVCLLSFPCEILLPDISLGPEGSASGGFSPPLPCGQAHNPVRLTIRASVSGPGWLQASQDPPLMSYEGHSKLKAACGNLLSQEKVTKTIKPSRVRDEKPSAQLTVQTPESSNPSSPPPGPSFT